jgi:hypothetical protein
MKMNPTLNKNQILSDIETIYQSAINDGKWLIALRAKELQGKIIGIFKKRELPEILQISDMTEEELREFVERLEQHDPELKNLELPEIKNS